MRALGMRRVFFFYILVVTVAFGSLAARPAPFIAQSVPPLEGWPLHLLLGLGVGLLIVTLSRVLCANFVWAEHLMGEFRLLVGDLRPREVLAIAILSGVGEEALFRGLLQPALGLWITSAIFAVLHVGPNRRFIPWTIMAFAAGLIFGSMYEATGSLLAPTIAHVVVNFLNLRFLSLAQAQTEIRLGPAGN